MPFNSLASAAFLASDNKGLGTPTQKVAIAFGETKDIKFVSSLTKGFDTPVYVTSLVLLWLRRSFKTAG